MSNLPINKDRVRTQNINNYFMYVPQRRIALTDLVDISTDCAGKYKYNYHIFNRPNTTSGNTTDHH